MPKLKKIYEISNHTIARLHANAIEIDGIGILIYGRSGIGKSLLCHQLLLLSSNNFLIGDDQVILYYDNKCLYAKSPEVLKGLFHIRDQGFIIHSYKSQAQIFMSLEIDADYYSQPIEIVVQKVSGFVNRFKMQNNCNSLNLCGINIVDMKLSQLL